MFEDLIPELQRFAEQLLYAAGAAGLHPRVTSTRRSHQAQVRLYRRYVSGLYPLPAAAPGQSAHEFGYAFDRVVTPFDALETLGIPGSNGVGFGEARWTQCTSSILGLSLPPRHPLLFLKFWGRRWENPRPMCFNLWPGRSLA